MIHFRVFTAIILSEVLMKTESAKESNEDNGKYQRRERFIGRIHCILTLPGTANATKMTTDYTNRVLTFTIPEQSV